MWEWVIPAMGSFVLNGIFGNNDNGNRPTGPAMVPPDFSPLWQEDDYIKWQKGQRDELLKQFYGGKMTKLGRDEYQEPYYSVAADPDGTHLNDELIPRTVAPGVNNNWLENQIKAEQERDAANIGPSGKFLSFSGTKPSFKYYSSQSRAINNRTNDLEKELDSYTRDRGIDSESAKSGAMEEQRKDMAQKMLELNSRSQDIRVRTLGQLLGEVSDAGPQVAGLVGNLAQSTSMWNQMQQNRYNNMMNQWMYNQQNYTPSFWEQMAGFGGSALPYMMYQGFGGQQASPSSGQPWFVGGS